MPLYNTQKGEPMQTYKNVILLDTVFLQEVDDETILLDTKTEEYFSLNEVGNIFYHMLKEEPSLEKAAVVLAEHFEVTQDQIEKDLMVFVKALEEKGLVSLT